MSNAALPFPYASTLVAPLRQASEKTGSIDYMQLWAGQAAALAKSMPAGQLTRQLAADTLALWQKA
jgi:nitronate monooxygenase